MLLKVWDNDADHDVKLSYVYCDHLANFPSLFHGEGVLSRVSCHLWCENIGLHVPVLTLLIVMCRNCAAFALNMIMFTPGSNANPLNRSFPCQWVDGIADFNVLSIFSVVMI